MSAYQTIDIDLTDSAEPDATLNAAAEVGWRLHTVLTVTETEMRALMEKRSIPPVSRVQQPRMAARP